MNPQEIFGRNVRRIRLIRYLSQEDLAEKAGLHRTYIGSIERGERNVSLNNIVIIAQALNTPIDELFRGITIDAE